MLVLLEIALVGFAGGLLLGCVGFGSGLVSVGILPYILHSMPQSALISGAITIPGNTVLAMKQLKTIDWKILIPRVLKNVITFISEHSMWIYLWHIPFVVGANMYNGPTYYWVGKWIICYSGAIMITYLQVFVISSVQKKLSIDYNWIKYLKS